MCLGEFRTSSQSDNGDILCKGPEATCLVPRTRASGASEGR